MGNNISLYNEIIEYINCYSYNFFNYTAIYFNNFDDKYKKELDTKMKEIINKIKKNYIDENFIFKFLIDNFELEPYKQIKENEVESYLEDVESMFIYSNNINNDDLKDYLFNLLTISFNTSYIELFNNFIINELL